MAALHQARFVGSPTSPPLGSPARKQSQSPGGTLKVEMFDTAKAKKPKAKPPPPDLSSLLAPISSVSAAKPVTRSAPKPVPKDPPSLLKKPPRATTPPKADSDAPPVSIVFPPPPSKLPPPQPKPKSPPPSKPWFTSDDAQEPPTERSTRRMKKASQAKAAASTPEEKQPLLISTTNSSSHEKAESMTKPLLEEVYISSDGVVKTSSSPTTTEGTSPLGGRRKSLATKLMLSKTLPQYVLPYVLRTVLAMWTDMRIHFHPSDLNKSYKSDNTAVTGRRMRAFERLTLGTIQFDTVCRLLTDSDMLASEAIAADGLEVLITLFPTVLYSDKSQTRVGCVARALRIKQLKQRCVETHPDSELVHFAAEQLNMGVLCLMLKARFRQLEKLHGRDWKVSARRARSKGV